VAAIALAHGLNANLVHQWRRDSSAKPLTALVGKSEFIEAKLAPTTETVPLPVARDIRIELRRGATHISVAWPLDAATHCAAWLGELLR